MGIKETLKERQGERLRQLQKEQGLTQKALGDVIHVSQKMISAIMNGRASLIEEHAETLATEYGYRAEWLLGHDPYKTKDAFKKDMQEKRIESMICDLARLANYKVSTCSWTNVDENGYHVTPSRLADMDFIDPNTGEKRSLTQEQLEPIGRQLISYTHFLIWQAMQEPEEKVIEVIEDFGAWLRGEDNGEE